MSAGVRVFFMAAGMILMTHLLAVKLFRPDPSLGKITGTVVMKWIRQVLAQHGLREKDIAGAVTDAGADVSTGVGRAFQREWCSPHMLNRVTVDGTGMSNSRRDSKNPECRDLLEASKKVIERFNRSTRDKVLTKNSCVSNKQHLRQTVYLFLCLLG